jgi:hypothetical protein
MVPVRPDVCNDENPTFPAITAEPQAGPAVFPEPGRGYSRDRTPAACQASVLTAMWQVSHVGQAGPQYSQRQRPGICRRNVSGGADRKEAA